MINWVSADSAPKDGTVILGSFKDIHPSRLVCRWCKINDCWAVAYPDEVCGEMVFRTEYQHHDDLSVWAEICHG